MFKALINLFKKLGEPAADFSPRSHESYTGEIDFSSDSINRSTPDLLHPCNEKIFFDYLENTKAHTFDMNITERNGRNRQLYKILRKIYRGKITKFYVTIFDPVNNKVINESTEEIRITNITFMDYMDHIRLDFKMYDNSYSFCNIPLDGLLDSHLFEYLGVSKIKYYKNKNNNNNITILNLS